jgi:hypothetical protein
MQSPGITGKPNPWAQHAYKHMNACPEAPRATYEALLASPGTMRTTAHMLKSATCGFTYTTAQRCAVARAAALNCAHGDRHKKRWLRKFDGIYTALLTVIEEQSVGSTGDLMPLADGMEGWML